MDRRLAAILAADVVGYSRLMGRDEIGTLAALGALRTGIVDPMIAKHKGRVFKSTGDGVLAEFASVVNAVSCAVEIQRAMDHQSLQLRVGVNLGDVIIEGDDVFGDGVNLAARLQTIAPPGGLAISKTVLDHLGNRLEIDFEDIGEHQFKNIEQVVRVYVLSFNSGNEKIQLKNPALPEKPSIAVLPFANLSDQPNDLIVDSMTEDLITALSRIGELFVISRNSSFVYKGRPQRVEHVARELGVRYVLEGSVRAIGNKVRVTAQLIDGVHGNHLWSEKYDEKLDDVFGVQDSIARNIALALQVKLTYGELARLWDGQTTDLQAWEKMAQARSHFLKFNNADNRRARETLNEALRIDPNYTGAMVLLGLTHWIDARFNLDADKAQSLLMAEAEARRALAVSPEMGSAYMLLGGVAFLRMQHDAAIELCQKAVRLAPSDSWAVAFLGLVYNYSGDAQGALAAFKEAMRLSPYPPAWYTYGLALAFQLAGDLANAEDAARLNLKQEPDDPYSYVNLCTALSFQGRKPEAQQIISELRGRFPAFSLKNVLLSEVYRDDARLDRVVSALRDAGLPH